MILYNDLKVLIVSKYLEEKNLFLFAYQCSALHSYKQNKINILDF